MRNTIPARCHRVCGSFPFFGGWRFDLFACIALDLDYTEGTMFMEWRNLIVRENGLAALFLNT